MKRKRFRTTKELLDLFKYPEFKTWFDTKYEKQANGCWNWTGSLNGSKNAPSYGEVVWPHVKQKSPSEITGDDLG